MIKRRIGKQYRQRVTVLIVAIVFLILPLFIRGEEVFRIIQVIGDNRDSHLFADISGAVLTQCNDIIICDRKLCGIFKYDREGSLVKRIGQKGRGPGDFFAPEDIMVLGDELFLLDRGNSRVAWMNSNLENVSYAKLPAPLAVPSVFKVIDKNHFIVTPWVSNSFLKKEKDKRIFVLGLGSPYELKVDKVFFSDSPIMGNGVYQNNQKSLLRMNLLFSPVYGLDDTRHSLLVTFETPNNPVKFFQYDVNGNLLRTFLFPLDKKYQFPHRLYQDIKEGLNVFSDLHTFNIRNIFFYKSCWYIFLDLEYYRSYKDVDIQTMVLAFDREGKLVKRGMLTRGFICFNISADGYALGKEPDAEIEQLLVIDMNF